MRKEQNDRDPLGRFTPGNKVSACSNGKKAWKLAQALGSDHVILEMLCRGREKYSEMNLIRGLLKRAGYEISRNDPGLKTLVENRTNEEIRSALARTLSRRIPADRLVEFLLENESRRFPC